MAKYRKNDPLMNLDLSSGTVVIAHNTDKIQVNAIPVAIIYARVSSDKQKNEGSGLVSQEQSCKDWCKNNGDIKVLNVFKDEGISGSITDRKGLIDAIKFLEKENKKYTKITHFLCSEISRIIRPENVAEGAAILSRIEATGAKIVTTLEHRDTSTDEGKLMDDIKLSIARYERKKIMKRARNGQISKALNGDRPFGFVPLGYKKEGIGKKVTIVIDEDRANIISEGLEFYANNVLISKADLLGYFKSKGLATTQSKGRLRMSFIEKTFALHRLFFYCGLIMYPDWGITEPIQGKWKPIISLSTLHRLIDKIQKHNKTIVKTRQREQSDVFPLRGVIVCPGCGRKLTSWYSTSSTGKKHPYYGCSNKFCTQRENIPKEVLEGEFEKLLNSYTVTDRHIKLFDAILREERNKIKEIDELNRDKKIGEKKRIENRLKTIEETMLKTNIADLYEKLEMEWSTLNAEKKVIEEDLKNGLYIEEQLLDLSNKLRGIVSSPLSFWKLGNLEIKQLLIGVRYGGNFRFSKKSGYRTSDSGLLNYFSKVFGDNNTAYYPEGDLNPHVLTDTRFGV